MDKFRLTYINLIVNSQLVFKLKINYECKKTRLEKNIFGILQHNIQKTLVANTFLKMSSNSYFECFCFVTIRMFDPNTFQKYFTQDYQNILICSDLQEFACL